MKAIILALALLSLAAVAVEGAKEPTATEPAKVEKTAVTKEQKKEAKEACLKDNPALKKDKKALHECIKTKLEEKK